MINSIVSVLFLKNITCSYAEIEGKNKLGNYNPQLASEIEAGKYYWFESLNEIFLIYFDSSLKFHKNPFILLILVPGIKKERFLNSEDYLIFSNTFDNFHKTAAFSSLVPNNQSRPYYSISVKMMQTTTNVELRLGEKIMLFKNDFSVIKEITHYNSLLKNVTFGTMFWFRFYEIEDEFYGLFIETCYVIYQRHPKITASLFKSTYITEIKVVEFKTSTINTKVFLSGKDEYFTLYTERNPQSFRKKQYFFHNSSFNFFINAITFNFEKNKADQLQICFQKKQNDEEIKPPKLEKLQQTSQRVYLFEDGSQRKHIIQLPTYYFGKRLEISGLLFWIKVTQKKNDEIVKVDVFLEKFRFNIKENSFSFYLKGEYRIFLHYFIEKENIILEPIKIVYRLDMNIALSKTETGESHEIPNLVNVFKYLNGSIVYDKEFVVTLSGADSNAEEQEAEQKLKTVFEQNSHKNKIIYMLISLFLIFVSCLLPFFFSYFRKKSYRKRGFISNRKKE